MNKQVLRNAFKYGLGLGLLAYVLWKNWPALSDALQKPFQVGPFVLAAVFGLASVITTFVRWYVLVRAQDLPFTLSNAIRLGLVGYFFSSFLPGSTLAGDVVKATFIAREQNRRTVAVATVLIDRAVGLVGLFGLVMLLGAGFWVGGAPGIHERWSLQVVVLGAAGIVAAGGLVWLLLGVLPLWRVERFAGRLKKLPKVGGSAAELWRAVWMYRCRGRSIALALAIALVGHVGFVLTFYFAAQSFLDPAAGGQIPSLEEHFLIVPIGMLIQSLFPTPGGIGAGEYGFGKLYQALGKAEAGGVLGSLVVRAINWVLGIAGYLVFLWMRPALRPAESDGWTGNGVAAGEQARQTVSEKALGLATHARPA